MSVLELIMWQVSYSVLLFNKPQYLLSNLQDDSSLLSVGLMWHQSLCLVSRSFL